MLCTSASHSFVVAALAAACVAIAPIDANAADHGDAPRASADRSTDIADVYAFLDPNDNGQLVLIMTIGGFVVPGEAPNFGAFDAALRYTIELETTGDARPDQSIQVEFAPRRRSSSEPQEATVRLPSGRRFRALSTSPTTGPTPNPFRITTDSRSGVQFFAGLVDDPFFFDLPGFNAFVASVLAGSPDLAPLARGRDTFAGYNVSAIAIRLPLSQLRLRPTRDNPTGAVIGVQGLVERRTVNVVTDDSVLAVGRFRQVERMGNPAINVVLVPFARKDEQNLATPIDDANGRFASDIVATLTALGTNQENIGILAGIAVARGDLLRLDTSIPNSGPGGGSNVGAGFPSGRRLGDDVVDTLLFFVANQTPIGDSVDANDVPFGDVFPFLAPQQTAKPRGTLDDSTRN